MGISEKVKNVGNLFRIQTIRPGKVTKFMDSLLKLLNALGLFKSPGRRQSPYSHLLQSFYMGFAQGQFAFCLVLIYSCTFVCSSKDFLEFFTLLMEVTCMTMILTEVLLLNTKRAQLLKLLERINKFDVASYPSPLMKYHWLEQFTWLFYGGFTFVTYLIKFVGVFIPITAEEVEHTRRIYGLKYPQNRLPVCMWIPYVDTSEPRYYVPLYLQELYMATLGFSMVMTSALLIPFIILHLVGQHLVLCRWLESLGKNCVGAGPGSRLQDAYDVYQMRRCIVLHRRLLDFRSQFDSVMGRLFKLRVFFLLVATNLSAYPITIISTFDTRKRIFLLVEFTLVLSFYYVNCLMSEILEWANCRIRRSVYQSAWYRMCPAARRMMLMFLRRTQASHHIRTLGGMVVLGNVNCMKKIKVIGSFIRFVNMKKT